jgi:hypothetical protein
MSDREQPDGVGDHDVPADLLELYEAIEAFGPGDDDR